MITMRTANAAATRSMAYWFRDICMRPELRVSNGGKIRAAVMSKFIEADEVCRASGKFFTPEQHERYASSIEGR